MKLSRKELVLVVVIATLIIAGGLFGIVWYCLAQQANKEAESISNRIEDWALYKTSNQNVSLSSCDNQEYKAGEKLINQGVKSELKVGYGYLILQTKNPTLWTNEKFRSFLNSKCTKESFVPIRAYPDKLLWKKEDCTWLTKAFGCETINNALLTWEQEHAQSSAREFNEGGIHFEIPPHDYYAQQSVFLDYSFYTEGNLIPDTSSIRLSIPPEGTVESDDIPINDIPAEAVRKQINWGNLQGDRYVYDRTFEDGYTWKGTVTYEIYPVSFSKQPIILRYSHSIRDDTLETLWTKIHTEIKMELKDNLGSYQSYHIKPTK